MQKRTRLILLLAVFLCLIPLVYFVNRDTTPSQADVLKRVAREDRAFLETKVPAVTLPRAVGVKSKRSSSAPLTVVPPGPGTETLPDVGAGITLAAAIGGAAVIAVVHRMMTSAGRSSLSPPVNPPDVPESASRAGSG